MPEALEVVNVESDALDDGDLLCDEQGDALGDDVPVRESARLPLSNPLEDRSGVLLTLLVTPETDDKGVPVTLTERDVQKVDTTEFEA